MQKTNEAELKEIVRRIIQESLCLESLNIGDDDDLVETLGADSLETVEFVLAIEDEFEIEIPDTVDASKLMSVNGVVAYLKSLVK